MSDSDNKTKPASAADLYKRNVAIRKKVGVILLKESDPLSDEIVDHDERLHPFEVAVFGIDLAIQHEMSEAMEWYLGAIALISHNDYYDFRNEERINHPEFAQTENDDSTMYFSDLNCIMFMHKVIGLPLGQCTAWVLKRKATLCRQSAHDKEALDFDDVQERRSSDPFYYEDMP